VGDLAALLHKLVADGGVARTALSAIGQELVSLGSKQPPLVFAIPKYKRLARAIVEASNGWLELGVEERKKHKDGKGWHRFVTPLAGREVILVGGTITDGDQMELYRMGYNAWYWNAQKLTFLIPYHGDARQERAQVEGESVDGLFASKMFTSIPKTAGGNRVFLVDIHADAITGFFLAGDMRCTNIEVLNHIIAYIAAQSFAEGTTVVAAPDAGRARVVVKTAKQLKKRSAIAIKNRDEGEVETQGLIGDVEGCNVILSDDMGVSFDSAIGAGKFLKQNGALDVVLAVTHGVIPSERYMRRLVDSGIFSCLYVTDSLPHVHRLARNYPGKVRIVPLAPLVVSSLLT
jgi:ribose-phosphate pyrophosphokinase